MNRKIMQNCIPAVIALTLTGFYSIVDGLFIGNAVGENGLAAINVAWPIPALVTALGTGIGTGGCVQYSIKRGSQDTQTAKKLLWVTFCMLIGVSVFAEAVLFLLCRGILLLLGARGAVLALAEEYAGAFLLGTVFSALGAGIIPILRSMQCARQAMEITVAGMLANLLADYCLIIKWQLGMAGAAIGSVAAQGVVCLLGIACLARLRAKRGTVVVRPKKAEDYKRLGTQIFCSGLAAFGVSLSPTLVLIVTNWQCERYGSTAAIAAYAAISYLTFPAQYILQGVGEGMLPLLSYSYGAGKQEELRELSRKARCILAVLGIVLFLLVQLFLSVLTGCFGLSEAGKELFARGMQISSFAFAGIGYVKWNIAYSNGTAQMMRAVFLTYIESLVVAPLLLFLLPLWFGIDGVWLAFVGTTAVMLLLYQAVVWGEKRKKREKRKEEDNGWISKKY